MSDLTPSAPGESLPPPQKTGHGTVSDIRHDIVKTRATISELGAGVTDTHAMVSNIHRAVVQGQEGSGGKPLLVRQNHALVVTKWPLIMS